MTKFSIYKITNISNNKSYIGMSSNIQRRFWQHRNQKNDQYKTKVLYRAFEKYGIVNFDFSVLCETLDKEYAKSLEIYFIEKFQTTNPNYGYNSTIGGDGIWGYKWSKEQKNRQSESQKKRFSDPQERKRYSEMKKGKTQSEESNIKRSKTLKGRATRGSGWSMTEEQKKTISEAMIGHKKSEQFKQKTAKRMSKIWQLTDPNGQTYVISNLRRFCRENKLSTENLWKVSKGIISQSQGWKCILL